MNNKILIPGHENISNVLPMTKTQPTVPTRNWLKELLVGTVFLTKELNKPGFVVNEFHVVQQQEKCTQLMDNLNSDEGVYYWVDSMKFSGIMELVEVIGKTEESNEQ